MVTSTFCAVVTAANNFFKFILHSQHIIASPNYNMFFFFSKCFRFFRSHHWKWQLFNRHPCVQSIECIVVKHTEHYETMHCCNLLKWWWLFPQWLSTIQFQSFSTTIDPVSSANNVHTVLRQTSWKIFIVLIEMKCDESSMYHF